MKTIAAWLRAFADRIDPPSPPKGPTTQDTGGGTVPTNPK